jgi:uncharacterized protein
VRSALFSPITEDDDSIWRLAETGIFSQWFHSEERLYYARWNGGEVDIVLLNPEQKPFFTVEVKWSDRFFDAPHELRSLLSFCKQNQVKQAFITTRTKYGFHEIDGVQLAFIPASVYAFIIGNNMLKGHKLWRVIRDGRGKAIVEQISA